MTKSEIKNSGKQLSKSTKYRIKKYVLLVQFVLLGASGGLAMYAAFKLDTPSYVHYLAIFAGAYALVEALHKLDKAIK